MSEDLQSWIGVPFLEGGRTRDEGIDCLGIVLLGAELLGIPARDPWDELATRWETEGDAERAVLLSTGLPPGWERVDPLPGVAPPGAVCVLPSFEHELARAAGHLAIVWRDGMVYSAREGVGVFCRPWDRIRPRVLQLWSYNVCRLPAEPARFGGFPGKCPVARGPGQ